MADLPDKPAEEISPPDEVAKPSFPPMQDGERPTKPEEEKVKEEITSLGIAPPSGKSKTTKIVLVVLAFFFLLASIPAAVYLVKQRQEIRKEAEGECPPGSDCEPAYQCFGPFNEVVGECEPSGYVCCRAVTPTPTPVADPCEANGCYDWCPTLEGGSCSKSSCTYGAHWANCHCVPYTAEPPGSCPCQCSCVCDEPPSTPTPLPEECPPGSDCEPAYQCFGPFNEVVGECEPSGYVCCRAVTPTSTPTPRPTPTPTTPPWRPTPTPRPIPTPTTPPWRPTPTSEPTATPTPTLPPGITPTPTLPPGITPTPTPTPPEYTAQCAFCKVYNEDWNEITDLSTLTVGQTVYFATSGSTTHPEGITKARFRFTIDGEVGSWQETTKKHEDEFYIEYTIPSAGSYTVGSMVYNPALGWY